MSIKDKEKWDKKYLNTPKLLEDREASVKVKKASQITNGKNALDIACGAGRNSIYLAKNDFKVDAVDISEVALKNLKSKSIKNINPLLFDLDEYSPKENYYNLIVMTNFLDRKLISKLEKSLTLDGILVIETYMDHPINNKPNSNSSFLLKKDELKTILKDSYEIVEYDEFENEAHELYRMMKQSIIAKKR